MKAEASPPTAPMSSPQLPSLLSALALIEASNSSSRCAISSTASTVSQLEHHNLPQERTLGEHFSRYLGKFGGEIVQELVDGFYELVRGIVNILCGDSLAGRTIEAWRMLHRRGM